MINVLISVPAAEVAAVKEREEEKLRDPEKVARDDAKLSVQDKERAVKAEYLAKLQPEADTHARMFVQADVKSETRVLQFLVAEDVYDLKTQLSELPEFSILGGWDMDTGDILEDFPVDPGLHEFMPDIVDNDEEGNEKSRRRPKDNSEIAPFVKMYGQEDRKMA